MAQAKQGDTVKVHYTGRLNDGEQFDSSREGDPLEFTIGEEQLIPGFEKAVIGMSPGENKSIQVTPEEGYGPRIDELEQTIPRDHVPGNINLEVGMQLQASTDDNQSLVLTVTQFNDDTVTVDANHPLAGKDLAFDIELVEILGEPAS